MSIRSWHFLVTRQHKRGSRVVASQFIIFSDGVASPLIRPTLPNSYNFFSNLGTFRLSALLIASSWISSCLCAADLVSNDC